MRNKIGFPEIENIVGRFAANNAVFLSKIDIVVGISRGGLAPAALLAARIDKPLAAAYIDKNDNIFFDRADWINGKNILVVDDVIRSGKTLWLLKEHLKKYTNPAEVSFFALYRIAGLARPEFHVKAFARDVNHDIVFPWDHDRR